MCQKKRYSSNLNPMLLSILSVENSLRFSRNIFGDSILVIKVKKIADCVCLLQDEMVTVFENGKLVKNWSFDEIRERADSAFRTQQ